MFYLIIQPPHRSLTLGQQLPEMFILLPHSVDLLHQSIHTASDRLWIGRKRVESQNPFVRNFASKQYIFEGSIRLKKVILNFQQKKSNSPLRPHSHRSSSPGWVCPMTFASRPSAAASPLDCSDCLCFGCDANGLTHGLWKKNQMKTATENVTPKTQTFQNN